MAKFLIGVLTGIILTGLFLVIADVRRGAHAGEAPGCRRRLDAGDGNGRRNPGAGVRWSSPFLSCSSGRRPTVADVWATLRKAAADSRIKAIVFEPRNLSVGWAKLEEMRADLENFRKSGKPVYAYLKTPGAREYYLATAATRVYMDPEDELDLKGMRFELMYFKNTLDKLGVQVEIEHAGKYKDFGDMFTRTSMSPETKEVLNSVIDDLYGNLVQRIAGGPEEDAGRDSRHHRPGPVPVPAGARQGADRRPALRRPDV